MIKRVSGAVMRNVAKNVPRDEPNRQQLHREMLRFASTLRTDRAIARRFLIDAGILTSKGNLCKVFRG